MPVLKLWRGEYSLPVTYWVFGVIGNIALGIPLNLMSPDGNQILFYSFLALAFVYSIVVAVGIWRSASKYQGLALWKYLAKFIAILSFISVAATSTMLIPTLGTGSGRTDYQLVSECQYDQLLNSKPNLEAQVLIASTDYCQQLVFNNLKEVTDRRGLSLAEEQKKGLTAPQVIYGLLMESAEQKKFKPAEKYQTIAQCKLDQLGRVKNATNPNIYAAGADQLCNEYVAISLSQKIGYELKKAMAAGYSYKEIAEYIEANPIKK
jgi:hypothetical protein